MTHPFKAGQTIDAYLAEHAGGGTGRDLSGVSTTTLEFMALDGDQDAIAELEKRRGGDGGATTQDLGNGLVLITHPDGSTEVRSVPTGTTGTGSAPSFASTQAAQTQAETFEQAQADRDARIAAIAASSLVQADKDAAIARIQAESEAATVRRDFDREQNALAEEAALKRQRLGVLSSLISDFMGAQSQARNTLANLPADDFRFAAVAGGVAPFGATPQQGFQGQLQNLISAPVPTADPSGSAASLEHAIGQLQGFQAPTAPVFGAAGGASIPLPAPGQSVAVRVGEEGEEILKVSAQGVEVIPLGGNFAHGGTIGDFNFQEIPFDRESLLPAFTTSGIFPQGLPRGEQLPDQSIAGFTGGLGFPQGFFKQLGVRPQFVSKFGSDEIFFRDPTTPGQFRLVTDTAQSGATGMIQPGSVTQFADLSQFGTLGSTAIGGEELSRTLARGGERPSAFTKFSAPIIEPTTGVLLPAPFMVAEQMNQLRLRNPTMFNLLLSAYSSAGVPPQAVLGGIESSLSFGAERGAVGLR